MYIIENALIIVPAALIGIITAFLAGGIVGGILEGKAGFSFYTINVSIVLKSIASVVIAVVVEEIVGLLSNVMDTVKEKRLKAGSKKQIVNIKRHGFPTQASLTHFSIETVHRRPDFHMIVLLHYLQQIIKTLLAQNHTVIGHLHFFLVEIDVLFASKSLKGTKHTGIPV